MADYEWLRKRKDHIRSRRAAMFPDEEPDDDALSGHMVHARNESRAQEERTETKRRRGELPPEGQ